MNKLQALHNFWSGFGWKAYDAASVPDNAELPYITHEAATGDFDSPIAQTAGLWCRASSWNEIEAKKDEIEKKITRGGVYVPYDGGALIIQKANPWAQHVHYEDDTIRWITLNYTVEYID